MPPVTNPSPEEVLETFHNLGMHPLRLDLIGSTILRKLVARGVYLAGHITSPADQTEFDLIDQELANRMLGRDPVPEVSLSLIMPTTCKFIDRNMKSIFESMENTGIPLLEGKVEQHLLDGRANLARMKQAVNRDAGFMVDIHSCEDWVRAALGYGFKLSRDDEGVIGFLNHADFPVLRQLRKIKGIYHNIEKLQQVYDLAKGNKDARRRPFGLYPRYTIGPDGRVTTVGELSIGELPNESLPMVCKPDSTIIRAKYTHLELRVLQALSGDCQLGIDLASGDPYEAFAQRMWGPQRWVPESDEWKTAKVIVQVCQLGGGPREILERMRRFFTLQSEDAARNAAESYWTSWRGFYPDCVSLFEELVQARGNQTVSIFGRILAGDAEPRSHTYSAQMTPADCRAIWFPLQATTIDLVKVGLVNLADDYRFGVFGGEFLAIWPNAVALTVPSKYVDQDMLDLVAENLSNSVDPFRLPVRVKSGESLADVYHG